MVPFELAVGTEKALLAQQRCVGLLSSSPEEESCKANELVVYIKSERATGNENDEAIQGIMGE